MLDTKYMASITPLKELINSSVLGDIDKILDKEPFPSVKIGSYFILFYTYYQVLYFYFKINKENCEYSNKNEKLHEAGYDAYLTGYCYLRMLHYLKSFNSSKNLIDFYINKYLNLNKYLLKIKYLNHN